MALHNMMPGIVPVCHGWISHLWSHYLHEGRTCSHYCDLLERLLQVWIMVSWHQWNSCLRHICPSPANKQFQSNHADTHGVTFILICSVDAVQSDHYYQHCTTCTSYSVQQFFKRSTIWPTLKTALNEQISYQRDVHLLFLLQFHSVYVCVMTPVWIGHIHHKLNFTI